MDEANRAGYLRADDGLAGGGLQRDLRRHTDGTERLLEQDPG
jgi:hypothetical protein